MHDRKEGERERGMRGGDEKGACGRFPDSLLQREVSINLCRVNEFNLNQERENNKKSLKGAVWDTAFSPSPEEPRGCKWPSKGR